MVGSAATSVSGQPSYDFPAGMAHGGMFIEARLEMGQDRLLDLLCDRDSFKYSIFSPEIVRLAALLYVRFRLSLSNFLGPVIETRLEPQRAVTSPSFMTSPFPFKYFETSPEIIKLAVLYYIRYPLSHRQVEDILHERGFTLCRFNARSVCIRTCKDTSNAWATSVGSRPDVFLISGFSRLERDVPTRAAPPVLIVGQILVKGTPAIVVLLEFDRASAFQLRLFDLDGGAVGPDPDRILPIAVLLHVPRKGEIRPFEQAFLCPYRMREKDRK